jgi:hypothetical protein
MVKMPKMMDIYCQERTKRLAKSNEQGALEQPQQLLIYMAKKKLLSETKE